MNKPLLALAARCSPRPPGRHAGHQRQRHSGRRRRAAAAFHRPADRRRRQGRTPAHGPPTAGRRRATVVDGAGPDVLPGLIDAHGHVMDLGFAALRLDLTGTASLADLQQRLRDYAAAHPDAKWILGCGWNQELWPDKQLPDRRRPRRRRQRPAGRARAGRRPCGRRQQRGDEGRRSHRCDRRRRPAGEIHDGAVRR